MAREQRRNKTGTIKFRKGEKHKHSRNRKREKLFEKDEPLPDARMWFRYHWKITKYIKGNTSSMYRDNMCCRYCKSGEEETQEHMETCDFSSEMRKLNEVYNGTNTINTGKNKTKNNKATQVSKRKVK